MARQLKDLRIHPLADNSIKLVLDQQGYTDNAAIDKIVARTGDHWPRDTNTIHAHIKDGYGRIIEVVSEDPLIVQTSGYVGLVMDGYDGLIVSADGYTRARGVIRSSADEALLDSSIEYQAYCSIEGHYYLMGGFDIGGDGYQNAVWHSSTGRGWEVVGLAPWTARANAQAVAQGTDLWLFGGTNLTGHLKDLWHATIDTTTGDLSWDGAAVATVPILNEYIKGTYDSANTRIYVGSGSFNASTGAVVDDFNYGADAYNSVIHYDPDRNTLWHSKNGRRTEYIFSPTLEATINYPNGYIHRQENAAVGWSITHGLNSRSVAAIFYDNDGNLVEPQLVAWTGLNTLGAQFTSAVSGRAMVCPARYYASNTTWVQTDGYGETTSGWFIVGSDGTYPQPANITNNGSGFDVTWNSATDGYLIAWLTIDGENNPRGRRYLAQDTYTVSDTVNALQVSTGVAWWCRENNEASQLVIPVSMDFTTRTNPVVFSQAPGALVVATQNLRHDGYRDNEDPWSKPFVNLGVNAKDRQRAYLLTSDGVWISNNSGHNWERQEGVDANLSAGRLSPVLCEDNLVVGVDSHFDIIRSLDSGDSFAALIGELEQQSITWWGSLGVAVGTDWRLFIYKRPADVAWESQFGHLPGEIIDYNDTHYVLPYPHTVASGNTESINITLDTDYGRDVTADEFSGDWLHLWDTSDDGELYRSEILRNSAGDAGDTITVWLRDALAVTPATNDRVQIIRRRPEGAVYYSILTRQTDRKHAIHHEEDGSTFIPDREQSYDYYGHLKSRDGLPAFISTDANNARANLLHAELNRQRVWSGQHYNDADTLPPELLERLGSQLGVDLDETIDLQRQRHLVNLWVPLVDAYGPCLDGLNNLRDLVLGANSGVVFTIDSPNADTLAGRVVTVSLSDFADYTWAYSADNSVAYDTDAEQYVMSATLTQIAAELRTVVHRYLVHFRSSIISDPMLIADHQFNTTTGTVELYFDDSEVAELPASIGSSVLAIYAEPKARSIYKFAQLLRQLLPHWVQIKYE